MSLPPEAAYGPEQLDSLVQRFLNLTLPKPEWTHAAHVIVALWHVRQFGEPESIDLLRQRISTYNESVGVKNTPTGGYHETVTAFWTRITWLLATNAPTGEGFDILVRRSLSTACDKNLPFRFYSKNRLNSAEARQRFIPPDIQPLPNTSSELIERVSST